MVYLSPFIPGRMGAGLDILWSHSHPLLFEPNQTVHLGLKILKSSTSAHGVSTLVNCPSSVWDWKLEGLGLANQAPLEKPRVLHAMHCSDRRPIWVMHTCQREKCWSFFFSWFDPYFASLEWVTAEPLPHRSTLGPVPDPESLHSPHAMPGPLGVSRLLSNGRGDDIGARHVGIIGWFAIGN